jgi:endonuclease-3
MTRSPISRMSAPCDLDHPPRESQRRSTRPMVLGESSVNSHLNDIRSRLKGEYATPDLGNVEDVFGELVYALLSTRTSRVNYQRAFQSLRSAFPRWSDLAEANPFDVHDLLSPCGLHNRKSQAILAIGQRVFIEQGWSDLEHLRQEATCDVESYLTSLPEVGPKIAKCVCLYALNRPVFPVDVHNLRVLKRLGIVGGDVGLRQASALVEPLIPEEMRLDLHVNLIAHGRQICRPKPMCPICILRDLCPYFRSRGCAGWCSK